MGKSLYQPKVRLLRASHLSRIEETMVSTSTSILQITVPQSWSTQTEPISLTPVVIAYLLWELRCCWLGGGPEIKHREKRFYFGFLDSMPRCWICSVAGM